MFSGVTKSLAAGGSARVSVTANRTISLTLLLLSVCLGGPQVAHGQDLTRLADPTKPYQVKPQQTRVVATDLPAPKLSSVLVSPSRRLAVIDGQLVAEGDSFARGQVLEIRDGQVWIELADKTRMTLSLNGAMPGRTQRFTRRPATREESETVQLQANRDGSDKRSRDEITPNEVAEDEPVTPNPGTTKSASLGPVSLNSASKQPSTSASASVVETTSANAVGTDSNDFDGTELLISDSGAVINLNQIKVPAGSNTRSDISSDISSETKSDRNKP